VLARSNPGQRQVKGTTAGQGAERVCQTKVACWAPGSHRGLSCDAIPSDPIPVR